MSKTLVESAQVAVNFAAALLCAPVVFVLNLAIVVFGTFAIMVLALITSPLQLWQRRTRTDAEHLIVRARGLIAGIAKRHGLSAEWDNALPVEVGCKLPVQPGLDFPLWLNLQNNDEIGVASDLFSVEWFPLDDPRREVEFIEAVNGLISGDVRLLCFHGPFFGKPYKVKLQKRTAAGWVTFFTYHRGYFFDWPARTQIVVNGAGYKVRVDLQGASIS